ncbi:hypothetical protein COW46_00900 [Candidatus Gracilibacteria bacterium CG17_big_fil_post_rev_8_21_14_2_50_48_13]|nr:MAG: hypothetical protein COW46_00900 [Candidatus Gracilibacteria bacterium CG17_big_fil_post_rev_8_21_14_2_50_48_13]
MSNLLLILRTILAATCILVFMNSTEVMAQQSSNGPIARLEDGTYSYTYQGVTVPLRMLDTASAQLHWGGFLLQDKDQLLTTEDMRWTPDWSTFHTQVALDAASDEIHSYRFWYMWDRYVVVKVFCGLGEFCTMETTDINPKVMNGPLVFVPEKYTAAEKTRINALRVWPWGVIQDCTGGNSFMTAYLQQGVVLDKCGFYYDTQGQAENIGISDIALPWGIPFPDLPVLESADQYALVDLFQFNGGGTDTLQSLPKTPGISMQRRGELGLQLGDTLYCLQMDNMWTDLVDRVISLPKDVLEFQGGVFSLDGELLCPSRAQGALIDWLKNAGAMFDFGTLEQPDYKTFFPLHTSMRLGYDKNGLWVDGSYGYKSNWAVSPDLPSQNAYPLSSRWVGDVALNQFVWPGIIAGPFPAAGLTSMVDGKDIGARLVTRDGKYTYLRDKQAFWLPTNYDADLVVWLAEAVSQDVLRGRDDGTPSVQLPLLRAEGMTLLARALHLEEKYPECGMHQAISKFRDMDTNAWYAQTVCMVVLEGIVQGNPDGTLAPGAPLRVAEFLTMAARGADALLAQPLPGEEWYAPVMRWALDGKSGDWLQNPGDITARWWAAALTMYLLK